MKSVFIGLLLGAAALGNSPSWAGGSADDGRPNLVTKWEYRVVSKNQLLDLGKKDLAIGLSRLGDEGWELVAVDGDYIFKRPKDQLRRQVADIKRRILLMESDLSTLKERAMWAERMAKKGFLNEQQVETERLRLKAGEAALEEARDDLKALTPAPRELIEGVPRPEK